MRILAAVVCAIAATASPAAGATACNAPRIAVVTGTFLAVRAGTLTMNAATDRVHPQSLAGRKGLRFAVTSATRVRRGLQSKLADLVRGDRIHVSAYICYTRSGAPARLLARRITVY
jgi:hypothetical protein